jgi:hypothetical protein
LRDRVWKQIQGWLELLLSMGGKEVFIKSVMQAIPTFSMSCFKLPRGLCLHINSLIRNFWWGSKRGCRKHTGSRGEVMCSPKFAGGLGFQDIELFNLDLLVKQVWPILQNPDSLSARILKAVYFPTLDLLEATSRSHPSQIWRALLERRDVLKQGLIRRIGTGEKTHAWNQNWIPRDHMLCPIACKKTKPPVKVSNFINADTVSWNKSMLEEWFLPIDTDHICRIPLSTRRSDDVWAWHYESSGILIVRSVYRMLIATKERREDWLEGRPSVSNQEYEEKQWMKLWRVKVPSKSMSNSPPIFLPRKTRVEGPLSEK